MSADELTLEECLAAFLQTTTLEEAYTLLHRHPVLLSDQIDLLLSAIINSARQQGQEQTASALDERRDFIRSVREELGQQGNTNH